MVSGEEMIRQLQDWCQRAETSGIRPLIDFATFAQLYVGVKRPLGTLGSIVRSPECRQAEVAA
jgi:hypothetical protein